MSFKCIRQHAMLSLFLGIVNSSNVTDYNFNIEYEKRIVEHSTNKSIQAVSSILQCATNVQHNMHVVVQALTATREAVT